MTLKKFMTHRLAIFFPLAISFCARYIACVNFPVQVGLFMEYDAIDLKLSLKSHFMFLLSVLYLKGEISMANLDPVY